jgi:hypothetical protein
MGAFVGRIDELALLSAIVAAGYDGDVAAAVAVGDPGSGKSRLLSEVAERAERSNAFRVVGYEPERQVPLGSAVDLLRALSDSTSTGRRLGALAFDAAWEERSTLEPMRVFEAAHRVLRETGPTLVLVDDLQWVDVWGAKTRSCLQIGLFRSLIRILAPHTAPPRTLASAAYTEDFNAVKAFGRRTGSTRTAAQTELAPFWEGNASVHWNQAANQIARANHLSMSDSNRLLAVLNIAMADTVFTIWSAKRHYGADPAEVSWRPQTAITLADTDGNPDTVADPNWLPLITTPSHPEYPAGHPALNGAAATVLLSHFADVQRFTLTTSGLPTRTYTSTSQARADGNNARIWGGMHYPSTIATSDATGEAIADYVNGSSMQLLRGQE